LPLVECPIVDDSLPLFDRMTEMSGEVNVAWLATLRHDRDRCRRWQRGRDRAGRPQPKYLTVELFDLNGKQIELYEAVHQLVRILEHKL
jgi:hypothetical protein